MKIRKKITSAITPLSLLILMSSTACADTFLMKNGTEIKGSVISETHNVYLLRAEVSNNVYAEKTILKSEVAKLTKTDPSIAAYEKLRSILPTADLMDGTHYQQLISSKLEPFLKSYPSSPYSEDVQKILTTLKKEHRIIRSGGLKINGRLYTPQLIEVNKFDIQASEILHSFMRYSQKKQYRAALSTLERLENGYADSKQCRKAQKAALIILPRYEVKLQKLYDNVDTLIAKRKRALDSMSSGDSSRTKQIFKYEERKYQNMLNLATTNNKRNKWLPINQYFKEPIDSNLKMIEVEIKRINTASQKPTIDLGTLYRKTYLALEAKNYTLAKENFDKFKIGNPSQELVNELEPRLQDAKTEMEEIALQKKEAEKLAKKKEAEERARIAKKKKEALALALANKEKDDKGLGDKVRKNLNLNKKQEMIDKIPQ